MKKNKTPPGVTNPANPVGQPTNWPHNAVLHGPDLEGTIKYLERTFVESQPAPESAKRLLAVIQEATRTVGLGHAPVERNLYSGIDKNMVNELPEKATFAEKLGDLLPVVWADYRLWQAFARKPPEATVLKDALFANLLLKFYNLKIPFRDSVWSELRAQPPKWNCLQWLMMASGAHRFFNLETASSKDELQEGDNLLLNELILGKLMAKYADNPQNDWRPMLWQFKFPAAVLRRISQAAGKPFQRCGVVREESHPLHGSQSTGGCPSHSGFG